MKKNEFIRIMEELRDMEDQQAKMEKAIGSLFDGYVPFLVNRWKGQDLVVSILRNELNDDVDWITYFISDLNFGRRYTDGMIKSKDNKEIQLGTAEDLWAILTENA